MGALAGKVSRLVQNIADTCDLKTSAHKQRLSYAVRAPSFVKPEHNGENQHMKITSLL